MLDGSGWHVWWSSEVAPDRWTAPHPRVAGAVRWERVAAGVERGELRLDGTGRWAVRVVLVRLDPRELRLELVRGADGAGEGTWSIEQAPEGAVLAVNAGQFSEAGPWGWVVRGGLEESPPGRGPLAVAIAVEEDGAVSWAGPDFLEAVRSAGRASSAFQSYPVLLEPGGEVPPPLRVEGRGVDLRHRDSRLALGRLPDGRHLLALTRLEHPVEIFTAAPWGPRVPEMAALMGALGCDRAVLLDGGISAQLLLREEDGTTQRWRGFRKVPLALVAFPRG